MDSVIVISSEEEVTSDDDVLPTPPKCIKVEEKHVWEDEIVISDEGEHLVPESKIVKLECSVSADKDVFDSPGVVTTIDNPANK